MALEALRLEQAYARPLMVDPADAQRMALQEAAIAVHFVATSFSMKEDGNGIPRERGELAAHLAVSNLLRQLADKMHALATRGSPARLAEFFGTPG